MSEYEADILKSFIMESLINDFVTAKDRKENCLKNVYGQYKFKLFKNCFCTLFNF